MGKTWSFEEDFIVGKYFLSHIETWKEHLDELMRELKEAGYGSRDIGSVRMRIQNYEYIHTGKHGLSGATKQSRRIYKGIMSTRIHAECLQVYIAENYSPNVYNNANDLTNLADDKSNFIYTEPLGPSFQEVLFDFIDRRGMKDSDVYNSCLVGRDTFSLIRNGKRNVSKKTVRQLCFGLRLSYEEAVVLMESAGYAFSNNNLTDVIVSFYLKNKEYDIFEANATLYENKAELLFS